ncbi:ribosomal N-lysine methyltransferase set10 [Pyrus ussuriensis x Pyrus communis]|uniref:Ribosomal N-lysine methyltransferase set10 n=1 Tax=Pyrus ussuriensis x Pyrus communis TaxID=2448454 RepID=A0A5N5HF86_9ROSA|nr:ribosomal N-lysine methyltransferase set10 [Pyrus ussuriensis x Pyrus communis]
MASSQEEAKLKRFLQRLQVNGPELRGCKIKYSYSNKGGSISCSSRFGDNSNESLQDPLLGPECRAMFEEGDADDRFLMILYLTVERLRKNSSWKPYFDMLPTTFGNPLWFTDDELLELKGTTLYRATELQLVQSREGRQPSDSEVQAAVWEACGDSGALQLLGDLLNMRMTDLQESSGTEDCDTSLLENEHITESATQQSENNLSCSGQTNGVA